MLAELLDPPLDPLADLVEASLAAAWGDSRLVKQ